MSDLAPGLSYTWYAGEAYIIKDDKGDELEVVTKESEDVVKFIHAFDTWFTVSHTLPATSPVSERLWQLVLDGYNNLPPHVVRELPSIRGSIMPIHDLRG